MSNGHDSPTSQHPGDPTSWAGTGSCAASDAGDDGPPGNLNNLYDSGFTTGPGWGSDLHHPDEEPHVSGRLPGEGIMMAMDPTGESTPGTGRNRSAPVVAGVAP